MKMNIDYIPVSMIMNNEGNVRTTVDVDTELVNSIKSKGLISPLVVVPEIVNENVVYKVIAGNRRFAACKEAGLEEIPCIIQEMSELDQISAMLTENMMRKGLNAKEEADGFQLMFDLGQPVEKIAEETGFSKSTVYNRLKIASLDSEKVAKAINNNATLEDFAKIAEFEDEEARNRLLNVVGTKDFAYKIKREAEELKSKETINSIKEHLSNYLKVKDIKTYKNPCTIRLENDEEIQANVKSLFYYSFYSSTKITGEILDKLDNNSGYYVESTYSLTVYAIMSDEEVNEDIAKDKFKEECSEVAKANEDEKNKLEELFYELRKDFILKFNKFKKYTFELNLMYAKFVGLYQEVSYTKDFINMMKEFDMYKENSELTYTQNLELAEAEYNKLCTESPERMLFLIVSYNLNKRALRCLGSKWLSSTQIPYTATVYKEDLADFCKEIYNFFESIGYTVSNDECMILDGTHEVYENKIMNDFILKNFSEEV